jgi:hypothetical protein
MAVRLSALCAGRALRRESSSYNGTRFTLFLHKAAIKKRKSLSWNRGIELMSGLILSFNVMLYCGANLKLTLNSVGFVFAWIKYLFVINSNFNNLF